MKTLFEATVEAVDRAARCFAAENDEIDPEFWETLYGPSGDNPEDAGVIWWEGDAYDNL